MKNQLSFHYELMNIIENTYFQPPENFKIKYPCIIYNFKGISTRSADDLNYKNMHSYEVTLICKDPDNDYVDEIMNKFRHCRFDRCFVNDNLYHYTFVIYY